jgi:predicted AAA+ superfamily ATPase
MVRSHAGSYRPRILDEMLRDRLVSGGAVLVEGPKASGKTYTSERQAASAVYLDLDEVARAALRLDPSLVLNDTPPQLIDEWQLEATTVWNYVRDQADRRAAPGQFILTGSAAPDDDVSRHTGAGRVARLRMRPMSLFESGEATGAISLAALLAGDRPRSPRTPYSVADVVDMLVRGGWPRNLGLTTAAARRANRDYLQTIAEVDLPRVDPSRNDPVRAAHLLRALARNTAQDHKIARIAAAAEGPEGAPTRKTTLAYLTAFERLMVIEQVSALATHLRSRSVLRTAERTHFVDPSLAVAALSATPTTLLADLKTLGLLFESLAVRDVRIYAEPLDGTVHHYRDSDNLEVDIVVTSDRGWGAFEVKLGSEAIDAAAKNLIAFKNKVDTSVRGEPSVLGVITATGYGLTRDDGVVVVPITALGP